MPEAIKLFISGVAGVIGTAIAAGMFLEVQPKCNQIAKGNTMAEEVRAPLAGNILAVLVEAGAKVEADDEILVIEALKMENLVYAPCAGTVKEVKVKKGDKVEEDDLLLVIA